MGRIENPPQSVLDFRHQSDIDSVRSVINVRNALSIIVQAYWIVNVKISTLPYKYLNYSLAGIPDQP